MTFEAGPWHAFGTEMLERLVSRSEYELRGLGENEHSGLSADNKQKLGFVPDYSVVVRDDCTFLEVTSQSWLLAYRSTLMSREGPRPSFVGSNDAASTRTIDDDSSWTAVQDQPKGKSMVSPQVHID
ncbi:unnamed protein product [Cylicostephanus goldi]|uniref:Uncharacterized protein n=1 Tax=Cylicostephanus goldi TaxID=71465 RepID=A0A3P6TKD7_CYLGO|nr:unnamed protein product [Cylicostephanus goldi]